jgi:hypothetical protein
MVTFGNVYECQDVHETCGNQCREVHPMAIFRALSFPGVLDPTLSLATAGLDMPRVIPAILRPDASAGPEPSSPDGCDPGVPVSPENTGKTVRVNRM